MRTVHEEALSIVESTNTPIKVRVALLGEIATALRAREVAALERAAELARYRDDAFPEEIADAIMALRDQL